MNIDRGPFGLGACADKVILHLSPQNGVHTEKCIFKIFKYSTFEVCKIHEINKINYLKDF